MAAEAGPAQRRRVGRHSLAGQFGHSAATCAAVIVLAGCASTAGIAPVAQEISASSLGAAAVPALTPPIDDAWWRGFGDATLTDLVERALAGNPGLRVAQARLTRAAAAVAGAQAVENPKVDGTLDATRQHFSATGIYPPPLGGGTYTLANAQIGASWDLDLFGRNRAATEAAIGSQRAAQADAGRAMMRVSFVRAAL